MNLEKESRRKWAIFSIKNSVDQITNFAKKKKWRMKNEKENFHFILDWLKFNEIKINDESFFGTFNQKKNSLSSDVVGWSWKVELKTLDDWGSRMLNSSSSLSHQATLWLLFFFPIWKPCFRRQSWRRGIVELQI